MTKQLLLILTGLFLVVEASTCGAQAGGAAPGGSEVALQGYVPPVRGAPARRVGGSSRGVDDELPNVVALLPDHIGLTTVGQPTLYWYLSKPTSIHIEFTLIAESRVEPLIEVAAGKKLAGGIHAIRLSDYGVSLVPGVEYEWSIALVLNPEERSHDIISAGAIMRVHPSEDQKARLGGIDGRMAGLAYAEQGIWYDAIARLSEAIAADAGNDHLRVERVRLLEQIGLHEPAAYETRFVTQVPASPGGVTR